MKPNKHVLLFEELETQHTEEEMDRLVELNLISSESYFEWYLEGVRLNVNNLAWIRTEPYEYVKPNYSEHAKTVGIRAVLKFKDYDPLKIYPKDQNASEHTVEVINAAAEKADEWGAKFAYVENTEMLWNLQIGVAHRVRLELNNISKTYYNLDRNAWRNNIK